MQMPYKGFVRVKFTGGMPLATLCAGTSLTNLTWRPTTPERRLSRYGAGRYDWTSRFT